MRKFTLSILGLFLLAHVGFSQTNMDSILFWSSRFLDMKLSDETKDIENQKFIEAFSEELSTKNSFDNSYADLKSVSVQTSPPFQGKSFRIFTWFTIHKSGYKSHGLVQSISNKIKTPVVTSLNDQGETIKSAQSKTLNAKNWFGALYYNMVPFKLKGKKYFLLLGFNPGNGISHKKVVDVIQIMSNGQPRFGAPVFETNSKMTNRIILEYDSRAKITLRYNDATKMIVFDHLAPLRPELTDQYQYYVPDMSYDAFELAKDSWVYKADVDAKNATEENGSEGIRLVIEGVNDQKTLENNMSGIKEDKK